MCRVWNSIVLPSTISFNDTLNLARDWSHSCIQNWTVHGCLCSRISKENPKPPLLKLPGMARINLFSCKGFFSLLEITGFLTFWPIATDKIGRTSLQIRACRFMLEFYLFKIGPATGVSLAMYSCRSPLITKLYRPENMRPEMVIRMEIWTVNGQSRLCFSHKPNSLLRCLAFSEKRASQPEAKHEKRWHLGRFHQTMSEHNIV